MKFCQKCGRKNADHAKKCMYCDFEFPEYKVVTKIIEKEVPVLTTLEGKVGFATVSILLLIGIVLGTVLMKQTLQPTIPTTYESSENISDAVVVERKKASYWQVIAQAEKATEKLNADESEELLSKIPESELQTKGYEELSKKVIALHQENQNVYRGIKAQQLAKEKANVEKEKKKKEQEAKLLKVRKDFQRKYVIHSKLTNQHQQNLTIDKNGNAKQVGGSTSNTIYNGKVTFNVLDKPKNVETYRSTEMYKVIQVDSDIVVSIQWNDGEKQILYGYYLENGKPMLTSNKKIGNFISLVWKSN